MKSKSELDRILKCGTAVSGNPGDGQSPMIEMDASDTMAVIRFAHAAIGDLVRQVNLAKGNPNLKPYEFNDMVAVSQTICNWLHGVILDCEKGIKEMTEQ